MKTLWQPGWSLYVVTDSVVAGGRPLQQLVAAAIRGGAGVVQFREKRMKTRHMIAAAEELCRLCRGHGVPFLVNDRLDVALAVDADGLHVGQDDIPAGVARRLLGPGKILGVSVRGPTELREAEEQGADYVSVSPVFATPTKPDHEEPVGLDGLKALVEQARLPVVAIGGIDRHNAAAVMKTGVEGICVISAVLAAEDVEQAARELCSIIEAMRCGSGR